MLKKRIIITVIAAILCLNMCVTPVCAEPNMYASVVFSGSDAEREELDRLLMAKLAYDYMDGYEGMTIAQYVDDNPDKYAGEIWEASGITYQAMYDSLIGDWQIYSVYNYNKKTGLYAVAFRRDNNIVLTFRGSEMFTDEFALDESNDWIGTDFKFAIFNKLSGQFDDADKCYMLLTRKLNAEGVDADITFAGHSLGGALVTYESLITGHQGYAFDGACGHVIDLIYFYNYLNIDSFEGVDRQPFCNYTDDKGYVVADLIQHTNDNAMFQIDRETNLDNLNENTMIPKLTDAGSHIAWSSVGHEGNTIFLNEAVDTDENGYTYAPDSSVTLDINKNVIEALHEEVKDKFVWYHPIQSIQNLDYGSMLGSAFGAVKDGRVLLASSDGGRMIASKGLWFARIYGVDTVMYGGTGDDDMYGYKGDDVLIAGKGNNELHGSLGIDTYIIDSNTEGCSTIYDTGDEYSVIIFRNTGTGNRRDISVNDKIITAADGTSVTIEIDGSDAEIKLYTYEKGRLKYIGNY